MYEVSVTATVADSDAVSARSVLQGFCCLSERHSYNRLVFFAGPERPGGLATIRALNQKQQNKPSSHNGKLWAELHEILKKQSYIMQARFPVEESALVEGRELADTSSRFGTLRWHDIPDALGSRATMHVQRKMLEIQTPALENILRENKLRRKSEAIEETYTWWLDGVEYSLSRLHVPVATIPPGAAPTLPPLGEAFQPLVPFWTLSLCMYLEEASPSPEQMKAAGAQLRDVRNRLAGVFDFRAVDRLVHDTRIIERQNNIPAPLPQVVRA